MIGQVNDTNESLAKEIERIKFEYEQLKRYLYGRRSERHVADDSQLSLFDEGEEVDDHNADAEVELDFSAAERLVLRQSESVPILDEFRLGSTSRLPGYSPRARLEEPFVMRSTHGDRC